MSLAKGWPKIVCRRTRSRGAYRRSIDPVNLPCAARPGPWSRGTRYLKRQPQMKKSTIRSVYHHICPTTAASNNMAPLFILALLVTCRAAPTIEGLQLAVTNPANGTEGGRRFDREIGRTVAVEIMRDGTEFIWKVFGQQDPSQRKNVEEISLVVESMGGVAYTANDEIHLSADYVASYSGDLKREIRGVLYHELTHVWQWNGNGNAPSGLIEGVADYVRLTAGLAPSHWVKPGSGDRWDQGYDVTAYFLQYCESLRSGFVALLNGKMRAGWSLGFFQELLGKSVDDLWKDYKAKYASSG